jgi:hypothetical protein
MNEASGPGMAGPLRVVARPEVQPARTPEEGGEAARFPPRHIRSWTGPGPPGGEAAVWGAPGFLWEDWGQVAAGRAEAAQQARSAGDGRSRAELEIRPPGR